MSLMSAMVVHTTESAMTPGIERKLERDHIVIVKNAGTAWTEGSGLTEESVGSGETVSTAGIATAICKVHMNAMNGNAMVVSEKDGIHKDMGATTAIATNGTGMTVIVMTEIVKDMTERDMTETDIVDMTDTTKIVL